LTNQELIQEISQFLYKEARLLDERKYKEWLGLISKDIRYWAPIHFTRERGGKEFADEREQALFDDSYDSLSLRVNRLYTEFVVAEDPPSNTCRLITNIEAHRRKGKDGLVEARSNFLIYKNRVGNESTLFAGSRNDVLKKIGEEWKVLERKIFLSQTVLADRNLTIFF
jgi:3-phenylpropionate/cinnamic acid dioxygenase small subunit